MKIVCPSCGAAYQVPEALLAKRHALKCSACGVKWRLAPPDTQTDAQASAVADAPAQTVAPVVAPPSTVPHPVDIPVSPAQPEEPPAQVARVGGPDEKSTQTAPFANPQGVEAATSAQGAESVVVEQAAPPPTVPLAQMERTLAPTLGGPVGAPEPEPEPEQKPPPQQQPEEPVVGEEVAQDTPAQSPTPPVAPSAVPSAAPPAGNAVVAPVVTAGAAEQPLPQGHAPRGAAAPLAAHLARPAYKPGSGSVLQTVRGTLAGWSGQLAGTDVRGLVLSERFWRGAWIASLVLAVLVVLGVWHWWAALVQAWPAAARLHQPG